MVDVVIVDAVRTPIGALGGGLARVRADDLAALVIKTIAVRNDLDAAEIDEVTWAVPTRPAKITATWRAWHRCWRVAGDGACGDLQPVVRVRATAVNAAFHAIRAGEGEIIHRRRCGKHVACSLCIWPKPKRVTRLATSPRMTLRWAGASPIRAWRNCTGPNRWVKPRKTSLEQYGITREEQDRFAAQSHARAIAAMDGGKFMAEEIIPVPFPRKRAMR